MYSGTATSAAGASGCGAASLAIDVTRTINGYASGEKDSQWKTGDQHNVATLEVQANETGNATTVKTFCSMDTADAPSTSWCSNPIRRPTLSLTYAPVLGQQSSTSTTEHGLSSVSKIAVNNDTGNMFLTNKDLDIPGIGQDLQVMRYYNSQSPTSSIPSSPMGTAGWSLSVGPDVSLVRRSNIQYDYVAPSGTLLGSFVRKSSDPSSSNYLKFSAPTYGGVDADLVDNGDKTFTMTMHSSQMTYTFNDLDSSDDNLYLHEMVDRSGNTLRFGYNVGTHQLVNLQVNATDADARRVLAVSYNAAGQLSQISDSNGPTTRTWTYAYTGGDLVGYTDPTGARTDYTYTTQGGRDYLTKIQDPAQPNGSRATTLLTYRYAQATLLRLQVGVDASSSPTYKSFSYAYQSTPANLCPATADRSTQVTDQDDNPGGTTTYCFSDRKNAGSEQASDVYDGEGNHRSMSFTPDQKADDFTTAGNQGSAGGSTTASYGDGSSSSPNDQLQSVTQPQDSPGDTAGNESYAYSPVTSIPGSKYLPTSDRDANGHCTAFTYYTNTAPAPGLVKDAYLGAPLSGGTCSKQTSTSAYHADYNPNGTLKDTYDPNGSTATADQTTYTYWAAGDTGVAAHGRVS